MCADDGEGSNAKKSGVSPMVDDMSNFSDKAKSILASVAPLIGTAVGGPFGALAGSLLAKALGKEPSDDAAMEAAVTSGDPEILLKIKEADSAFKLQMEQLGITREKLVYDDRSSARGMQIATKDSTPRNLSYMMLAFTGVIISSVFFGWSKIDSALAGSLVGYLVSENKAIFAFWFGTTSGSEKKTETISEIAKGP